MIACHHGSPWYRPFSLRQDCQFLGQVTSAQIGVRSATATHTYRFKRTEMLAKFLEQIAARGDFAKGLTQDQPSLLDFIESSGATLIFDDICLSVGSVRVKQTSSPSGTGSPKAQANPFLPHTCSPSFTHRPPHGRRLPVDCWLCRSCRNMAATRSGFARSSSAR